MAEPTPINNNDLKLLPIWEAIRDGKITIAEISKVPIVLTPITTNRADKTDKP